MPPHYEADGGRKPTKNDALLVLLQLPLRLLLRLRLLGLRRLGRRFATVQFFRRRLVDDVGAGVARGLFREAAVRLRHDFPLMANGPIAFSARVSVAFGGQHAVMIPRHHPGTHVRLHTHPWR
jgi:hypothetical protein